MKKIFNFCLMTLFFLCVTSCDKGFDDLNTSKTLATSLNPIFVLNAATINSSPGGVNPGIATAALTYDMAIVQQMITSNSGLQVGGNFNQVNINNTPLTWQNYFQNVIRYTDDVITNTKNDPTRANLYNMARILQANAYLILTDTYGNIPYTQGGQGYNGLIFFPAYDTQESIYPKIIQELEDATGALDPAGKIETADVLYSGDISKWKKFGYSLLLRAGMHLTEVDAAVAQSAVSAAFTGGVILTNADNAIIKHDANYQNGIGNIVNGTEAANFYLTEPFVNALKSSNDPRLSSIAVRYVGATSGSGQVAAAGDTVPSHQYGMPMGSDDASAQNAAVAAGLGSRYAYSQADRNRILKRTSPMFIVTAAQTNLLLAEAAARGWIAGGNVAASAFFATGIRADMDKMATYDAAAAISATKRDTYVTANPLDVSSISASIQQIAYQYWIASFLHGPEAWANFRRTGFPTLTPNPYPGKSVVFITRITYPPSEILVNSANVQAAISEMGGDNLDTKVWWDK